MFGFDDQRCESAMSGRQARGESGWTRTNDDNIPVLEIRKVGFRIQLCDFEVCHDELLLTEDGVNGVCLFERVRGRSGPVAGNFGVSHA